MKIFGYEIGRKQVFAPAKPTEEAAQLPATGGRISEPEQSSLFSILKSEMQTVTPEFELEMLKVISYLAKWNADISYAVDNMVQLGNTPYSLTFDDSVNDTQAKKMTSFLNISSKSIYAGGINSLINDLFCQVFINGALSAEIIPDKRLTKVQVVTLVNPITMRFKYNKETYLYDPYQVVNGLAGTGFVGGENLVKLNPLTYKYYALRRFNDNPIGIPPILSALEMVEVERDMVGNMRHIIKKLGTFGFLNVLVAPPARKQGEDETTFYNRSKTYLSNLRPDIEEGFSDGIVLGYKNSHEFKVEGNELNVEGYKDLMELVTQMKMAGIKQDPLMLGRNFNVAETMARVILVKLTSQIGNYQRLVASFLEDIFKLILLMGGYAANKVIVEFEPPILSDKLKEEQAYKQRIENRKELRDTGVISQQGYAQEVGYEKPFSPKDKDYTVQRKEDKPFVDPRVNTDPKPDPNQQEDPTGVPTTDYIAAVDKLTLGHKEFSYGNCSCGTGFLRSGATGYTTAASYFDETLDTYSAAVKKITKLIADDFSKNGKPGTEGEFAERVLLLLYSNWKEVYGTEQLKVTDKWLNKLYKEFTKNDSDKVAELYLLLSTQALTYFKNSDNLYLVRFVTDADTRNRLLGIAAENYDYSSAKELTFALEQALLSESWKLKRVISTTSSKLENITELIRLSAAGVDKFQLISVKDSKRCNYCAAMDGKVFVVERSMEQLKQLIEGGPESVKYDAPFITDLFKGEEGEIAVNELTGEQLQAAGFIGFTPHANCRCKIRKL